MLGFSVNAFSKEEKHAEISNLPAKSISIETEKYYKSQIQSIENTLSPMPVKLSNITNNCKKAIDSAYNQGCRQKIKESTANYLLVKSAVSAGQSVESIDGTALNASIEHGDSAESVGYVTLDIANTCMQDAKRIDRLCSFNPVGQKKTNTKKHQYLDKVTKSCESNPYNSETNKAGCKQEDVKIAVANLKRYHAENFRNKTVSYYRVAIESRKQTLGSLRASLEGKSTTEKLLVGAAVAGAAVGTYALLDHNPKGNKGDSADSSAGGAVVDGTSATSATTTQTFSDTCVNEPNYHQNPACETLFISTCGSVAGSECSQFYSYYCGDNAKGEGTNFCTYQASVSYCQSSAAGSPACSWLRNQDQASCSVNLLDASCLPPAGSSITLSEFNSSCGYFPEDPLCESHKAGTLVSKWSVLGETTTTVADTTDADSTTETTADLDFTTSATASRTIAAIDLPKDIIQPGSGINLGTSVVNLYCATGELADCD